MNPELTSGMVPVNMPIPDRHVDEGATLTFAALSFDPNLPAHSLIYTLDAGAPEGASIDATTGQFAWTPSAAQSPRTNRINIVVSIDGSLALRSTNTFTVVVNEVNVAPMLGTIAAQSVNELTLLTVTNTATESNIHATLGYRLLSPPAGMAIDSHGIITWTPPQSQSPSTNFITTVATNSDPYDLVNPHLSATNTFTVMVKEVNVAPVLRTIATLNANELTLLRVTNTAVESNIHSTLGYLLATSPAGMAIDSNGIITWTPQQNQSPGTNLVTTIVTNSNLYDLVNPYLSATNTFTVIVRELNVAPVLPVILTQTVNELALLTVTNTATESNIHSTLGYALVNPPAGASIAANGAFTWTPSEAQGPSTNFVTTIATSTNLLDLANPKLSATNSFTVVVNEVNTAPVLTVPATQTINELVTWSVSVSAADSDIPANPLTFALVSAPTGMSINPTAGLITWTPSQAQSPSTNLVLVSVTDTNPPAVNAQSLSVTNSFTVIVREVNQAPVPPVIPTQTVNELTLLTVTNTATESNIHSALGYALVNRPVGMSIYANGVITWTPQQNQSPGTNLVTTIVTNSNLYDLVNPSLSATNTFTVIVKEVNVEPVLPVIPTQTVNELALLTVTNTATESNIHSTLGYALVNPPAGMSINANGVITWTPQQTQSPSTILVTTMVTNTNPYDPVNPHLSATNTFTVIVKEVNVVPVLPVIATQSVNELALLTVTNTATESNIHSAVGYALVNPPVGMSIDASGVITWMPSEAQGPGTNVITTLATSTDLLDLANPTLSATNSFTVVVNEVNTAPVIGAINDLIVNPGQTVDLAVPATDTDLPTNSLAFALLTSPTGMTIDGASGWMAWRPTMAQANTTNLVNVQVTDDNPWAINAHQLSATQSFWITVNPLTAVTLQPLGYTNNAFVLSVSGPVGPDYILQASPNLQDWLNLASNAPLAQPFTMSDTNTAAFTNRFYRVRLGP